MKMELLVVGVLLRSLFFAFLYLHRVVNERRISRLSGCMIIYVVLTSSGSCVSSISVSGGSFCE